MTYPEFIQLQKDVYKPGPSWYALINLYNRVNKTELQPYLRSTYITILRAIALKNGWEFSPVIMAAEHIDNLKFSLEYNPKREKWQELKLLAEGKINKTVLKWKG